MTLYDIVKKLTGPVHPSGEHYADRDRYDNLESLIELVDRLIFDLNEVAVQYDSGEASRAKAGQRAGKFLADLRDSL